MIEDIIFYTPKRELATAVCNLFLSEFGRTNHYLKRASSAHKEYKNVCLRYGIEYTKREENAGYGSLTYYKQNYTDSYSVIIHPGLF